MNRDFYLWEHAHVHSSSVAANEAINLEDLVCDGLSDDELRVVPHGQSNSIVWLLWHIARSEDVGINVMLAGDDQVLDDEWCRRMRIDDRDIGTGHNADDVKRISDRCDLEAVRGYRHAVGARSREVFVQLEDSSLDGRVDDAIVERAVAAGAFHPRGSWVADFWRGKQRRFFLWLGTGHSYMHLQEASVLRSLSGRGFGL